MCLPVLLLVSILAISGVRGQDESAAFAPVGRLLQARCALPGCHAGSDPEQGLNLRADQIYRSTVNVRSRSSPSLLRISPGDPHHSLLYLKLLSPRHGGYRGGRMPLSMNPLNELEIELVRLWIESFSRDLWPEPPTPKLEGAHARSFQDSFLIDLPTPDALGKEVLEFRIIHRFKRSAKDAGGQGLYGLDGGAWISFGLAYGLTDRLEAGLRRTNLQQDYEAYFKTALLRQGSSRSPLSISFAGTYASARDESFANRTSWGAQAIFARRFNNEISGMIVPIYVTRTNSQDGTDEDGTAAVGLGVELRLTPKTAITGEWITQTAGVKAPFEGGSIAYSVATSRHVFAIVLTNSPGIHLDLYAPGGDLEWKDGQFRLGFNISRNWGGR